MWSVSKLWFCWIFKKLTLHLSGLEPETSWSEVKRSIQLKLKVHQGLCAIYIGFYSRIRFKFFIIFLIKFFRSLTVQTNHLILRYKVLNLCWVPLPLKISSKLKTEVVPLLVTRSRMFNTRSRSDPLGSLSLRCSNIASRVCSRRVGGAGLNLLRNSI